MKWEKSFLEEEEENERICLAHNSFNYHGLSFRYLGGLLPSQKWGYSIIIIQTVTGKDDKQVTVLLHTIHTDEKYTKRHST